MWTLFRPTLSVTIHYFIFPFNLGRFSVSLGTAFAGWIRTLAFAPLGKLCLQLPHHSDEQINLMIRYILSYQGYLGRYSLKCDGFSSKAGRFSVQWWTLFRPKVASSGRITVYPPKHMAIQTKTCMRRPDDLKVTVTIYVDTAWIGRYYQALFSTYTAFSCAFIKISF